MLNETFPVIFKHREILYWWRNEWHAFNPFKNHISTILYANSSLWWQLPLGAPPGKMNYYYALVAAITDMESHGKSSDSTASSEAIDAWNKRNSAKPLSFQKQPNLASKDIASKIFIAPKELSNNRKLLKVWNLKLSNLFIHEKEGLFLLLLLQLFLLQQFDAQPFSFKLS